MTTDDKAFIKAVVRVLARQAKDRSGMPVVFVADTIAEVRKHDPVLAGLLQGVSQAKEALDAYVLARTEGKV